MPQHHQAFPTPMKQLYGGRSADNDIIIAAPIISARHFCIMLYDTGEIAIQDLGSTNGTFVNEKRINNTPTILQESDIVKLGDIILDWRKYQASSQVNNTLQKEVKIDDSLNTMLHKKSNMIKKLLLYITIVFLILMLIWYFTQITRPTI